MTLGKKAEDLLEKCRHYGKIYCYGAGNYGKHIFSLLHSNGINVTAFLLTNDEESKYCDTPIVRFDDVETTELAGSLIILSLAEKHHDDVKNMIRQKSSNVDIYPVTEDLIQVLSIKLFDEIIVNEIRNTGEYNKRDTYTYEEKLKKILLTHDKIYLKYMDARQIGITLLSWIYYNIISHPQNEYWAFYPDSKNRKINDYLLTKFCNEDMEVVSLKSHGFWRYMLERHRDLLVCDFGCYEVTKFTAEINKQFENAKKWKELIAFSHDEKEQGEAFLEKHNLNDYACIFARDERYTESVIGMIGENFDAINYYRGLPVSSFELVADYLHKQDISAVRMGHLPKARAEIRYVFDYASDCRTEFLDVFLFSRCRFFIGTPSGIQYFADLFNKPMVMVNVPVLSTEGDGGFLPREHALMIPQKYWDKKRNRYLTIREMLRYECSGDKAKDPNAPARTLLFYNEHSIVPVKNTPKEILEVSKEMIEILEGKVQYSELDERLQEKYSRIIDEFSYTSNFIFPYKIGRDFLRNNKWILD